MGLSPGAAGAGKVAERSYRCWNLEQSPPAPRPFKLTHYLLVTLSLGLISYVLRAFAARQHVKMVRPTTTIRPPAPPLPKAVVAERVFITLSGVVVFIAFALIVLTGVALSQL